MSISNAAMYVTSIKMYLYSSLEYNLQCIPEYEEPVVLMMMSRSNEEWRSGMALQLLETNFQQNQNALGLTLYLDHLSYPPLSCHEDILLLDDNPLMCIEDM